MRYFLFVLVFSFTTTSERVLANNQTLPGNSTDADDSPTDAGNLDNVVDGGEMERNETHSMGAGSENVFLARINPNGYFGDDASFHEEFEVSFDAEEFSGPISVCLWIQPFRYIERTNVLRVSGGQQQLFAVILKKKLFFIDGYNMNTTITFNAYKWYHICIVYGRESLLYYNETSYVLESTNPAKTIKQLSLSNIYVELGGDNILTFPFSGLIADLRIYQRQISVQEANKISLSNDVVAAHFTLSSYYETPENFYHSSYNYMQDDRDDDDELGYMIEFYLIEKDNFGSSNTDYFVTSINKKLSCEEAIDTCKKMGGQVPQYTNQNSLDELYTMVERYYLTTNYAIINFWLLDGNNEVDREFCLKGYKYTLKSSLGVENVTEGMDQQLSVLCLMNVNNEYTLKSSLGQYTMNAIPYFNNVYEDLSNGLRLKWDDNSMKMKFQDLKFDNDAGELFLIDGPDGIFGRNDIESKDLNLNEKMVFTFCSNDQFTCSSGDCIDIEYVCDFRTDCSDSSDEEFCQVAITPPASYENRVAPPIGNNNEKLPVSLSLMLDRMMEIDMADNTITLLLSLAVEWTDPRLRFKNIHKNHSAVIETDSAKALWHPRITTVGGITSEDKNVFHLATDPGRVSVSQRGNGSYQFYEGYEAQVFNGDEVLIQHSKSSNVKYLCEMKLFSFPFDTQSCSFILFLDGIIDSDAVWNKDKIYVGIENNKSDSALFSNLQFFYEFLPNEQTKVKITFWFTRKNGAYILHTFLPFVILEVIGMLTLYMPEDDYQDRVAVTLACLIVLASFFSQVSSSLPISADPKIIDYWMFCHIVLLFLVFFIHLIVVVAHERSKKQQKVRPCDQDFWNFGGYMFPMSDTLKRRVGPMNNTEVMKNNYCPRLSASTINNAGLTLCIIAYIIFLILFILNLEN